MFFNAGSGGIDIFWRKVNIWNINCVQATALIFDTRTDVLVKVSKFLRQKMSRPEGRERERLSLSAFLVTEDINLRGARTCNLRIHAECSSHLSYQGQTFAVLCFWTLALGSTLDNPGPLFTKKMPSYGYKDPHYKPKTVWRPSQVYNGNPYTDKTASPISE